MPQAISDTSSAFSRSQIAATLPHLRKMVADNVTDATPLCSFLMGRLGGESRKLYGTAGDNLGNGLPGVIVGGRDIHVPIQVKSNETVQSYAGLDPLDITHQDTDDYALFPIRQLAGSISIAGIDLRGNKGDAEIYSLLQGKVNRLTEDMRMRANEMFVADGTGNGGKDFLGLAAIVGTGTLGGVSPTTYPKWQPGGFPSGHARHGIVSSVTFSSTGLDNMRTVTTRVTFGQDGPDAIFKSRTTWEHYSDLMEGNIRYTNVEVGDASFKVLAWQGIRVFFDHALPDSAAARVSYFLNSRHIAFERHQGGDFEWIDEGQRPANQDGFVKTMIAEGNLVTDNRRMLGGITAIT